jgi:hypothetical protein
MCDPPNHAQRRSRSRHRRKRACSPIANLDNELLHHRIKILESIIANRGAHSISGVPTAPYTAEFPEHSPDFSAIPSSSRNLNIPSCNREQHHSTPLPEIRHENNSPRYQGRIELIPEFSGSTDGMTIDRWLDKINSIGKLYNWDDHAKIFSTIARLSGNAKSWYDCQTTTPVTWNEWEEKLKVAFPPHKNIASKLKDFVNIERNPEQDVISFYYEKLRMGKHCNLPDEVITDVIISTINNNIIRASAHAANCKCTEKLLLFLSDYNYVTQTHKHHSSGLNFKSQRFTKNDQHRSQNKFISKPFNNKDTNYSTVTNKRNITCFYCKKDGHTREMCFKLKTRKENSQPAQVQQISKNDAKYHINAKINNQTVTAYVDFGSACNLIKLEKAQELQLTIDKERAITIRGYGGALVPTLGLIQANVNVDSVTRSVPVYAVKNHHQEVDLLIGRPFTESSNTYVIQSADTLTFYEEAEFELLSSFHVEEICNKLAIHAEENTTVVPGINKIAVRTNLNRGIVLPNFSEQQHNSSALIVPSKPIEFHNCLGILTVYSISYANTLLRKGQCVARRIPSGQSQTEVPVRPSLLTEAQQTRLDKLLKDYDDCFAASTSELGNTNVEMRIKLTSTVPVCYKPYRLSFYEREVVRKIVADLMENNIIEPTVSEYASPILLVKKKSGEIRMVVDYRKLNSITEKDHYPLPNIEDQLERLAGHTCFTTLDMASGYHQLRVAEDHLTEVQRGINMTINATTGQTPSELLYGFQPRLRYDADLPDREPINRLEQLKSNRTKASGKIARNAINMKARYDKNRLCARTFQPGDMVFVERTPIIKGLASGKLVQKYIGPVQVTEVLPNDRYRVQSLSKDQRRFRGVVASDRMKIFTAQKSK